MLFDWTVRKNDLYKDEIDGDTVLNHALELIDNARKIVEKICASRM